MPCPPIVGLAAPATLALLALAARLQGVVAIEAIRDQAIIDRIAELPIHFDLVVIDEAHHLRNRGTLRFTFEGDSAHRDSEVHLINSHHPLTQFAISKLENDSMGDNSIGVVRSTSSVCLWAHTAFFVHSLEVEGVESRVEFVTIVLDANGEVRSDLADKAFGSIIEADDVIIDPPNGILDHWDEHRERANREISMIRDEKTRETQARNDALIEVRRVAIENTCQAKISRTQQRIAMGSNAFRRRMDEGKLAKLAVEKDSKIRQLIEERQRVGRRQQFALAGHHHCRRN